MARKVHIRGQRITDSMDEMRRIKLLMRRDFGLSDTSAEKLFTWLQNSGWDASDVHSAVKQASNTHRPPLEAYYGQSTPIVQQLLANQGVWTGHVDSASYPNFVMRNPGAAELLMRRITPGDQILLDVADRIERREDIAASDDEYWNVVYNIIINDILYVTATVGARTWNGLQAVAVAMDTQATLCREEYQLVAAQYMDPSTPLYCGVRATIERLRVDERFFNTCTISDAPSESYFKLASNLLCVTISSVHNFEQSQGRVPRRRVAATLREAISNAEQSPLDYYRREGQSNADQTPINTTGPHDAGDGGPNGGGDQSSPPPSIAGPEI